jgi:FkbM family methyltransferase
MNGADALSFRNAIPESTIYAFEPNPQNFRLMQADAVLRERNIHVIPCAVANSDGESEFFMVEADYSRSNSRRGMSSLYRRAQEQITGVRVETIRLDTFFSARGESQGRLALWIDAEGKGYEVVEGITGIAQDVCMVHVEVEASPCIAADQKLYPEVKELLYRLNLIEVATDYPPTSTQFNALFVRRDLSPWLGVQVRASVIHARLRRLVGVLATKMCPGCAHRYRAMGRRDAESSRQSGKQR